MEFFEVGKKLSAMVNKQEGVYFEGGGSGYTLIFNFYSPTREEIDSVTAGKPFEIRFTTYNGIIFITAKAGVLDWVDAPFTPHLSPQSEKLIMPEAPTKGTALTVIMTDAKNAVIKSLRMIGLSHEFSVELLKDIQRLKTLPFDAKAYDASLQRTQQAFSTEDLAKISRCRFKVNGCKI